MMKRSDLKARIVYEPKKKSKKGSASTRTWASALDPSLKLISSKGSPSPLSSKKKYNRVAVINSDSSYNDINDDDILDQSGRGIQLNLHNRLIKSLSESTVIELLRLQGRNILLTDIEMTAFIRYYKRTGKLDEGLEYMHTYAGHMDYCNKYIIEYTSITYDFLIQLMNLDTNSDDAHFRMLMNRLIRLTATILYTISSLRKYQRTPKPLWCFTTDLQSPSIDTNTHTNTKSVISLMRDISIAIRNNITSNIWKHLSSEELLVILAPGLAENEIEEIFTTIYSKSMTMAQAHLAMSIIGIVRIEDKVESVWNAFQSLSHYHALEQDNDNVYYDPFESFPLLRVNYDTFNPPTNDLNWFESATVKYQNFLDLDLNSLLTSPSKSISSKALSQFDDSSHYRLINEAPNSPNVNFSIRQPMTYTSSSKYTNSVSPIAAPNGTPLVYYNNGQVASTPSDFYNLQQNTICNSDSSYNNGQNMVIRRLDSSSIFSGESEYYNISTPATPSNMKQLDSVKKMNQDISNKRQQTSPTNRPKSATTPTNSNQKPSRNIVSASSKRRQGSPSRATANQLNESRQKINPEQGSSSKKPAKEVWIQDDVDSSPITQQIVSVSESQASRKSPQKVSLASVAKQIVHNGLIKWLYRVRRKKVLEQKRIAELVATTMMTPSKLFLIVKIQQKVRELMKRDKQGFTVYRRRLMKYRAVFLIQKHARRWLACTFVYRYIKASIIIKRIWLKFRGDRILRQNLRRVQIPLTITLHNLQNIPSHIVRFEEINVKISLWDHYLLHIVRDSDLLTILQSKEPRLTYYTKVFPVQANSLPQASQVERHSVLINDDDDDDNSNNDNGDGNDDNNDDNDEDDDDDDNDDGSTINNIQMLRGPKKSVVAQLLTFSRFSFGSYKKSEANLVAKNVAVSHVNFEEFKLRIPGCHGNSVLKFEFYEGSRKFGSNIFNLGKYNRLMFWGDEYTSEISIVGVRRHAKMQGVSISLIDRSDSNHKVKSAKSLKGQNSNNDSNNNKTSSSSSANDQLSTFHFSIKAGLPMQSRAAYVRIKIKGQGKVKQSFLVKNLYSAFFEGGWIQFFASMDHDGIYFYKNRVNVDESFLASSSEFASIRTEKLFKEIGIKKGENGKNEAFIQDTHGIVIRTLDGDEISLRFSKKQIRIQWMERLSIIMRMVVDQRNKNTDRKVSEPLFQRLNRMLSFYSVKSSSSSSSS